MLRYQTEDFGAIVGEMRPLWVRHWAEVANDQELIPLLVDEKRYQKLQDLGHLVIVTARAESGALVGYIVAILSWHLHYSSTLMAELDVFWLAPEHRQGMKGMGLFLALEKELKDRKVRKMFGQTKLGEHDVSSMFRFLGWSPVELLFGKVLS